MSPCNPGNARLIRRYLDELRLSDGLQPVTLEHTANAIAEFEAFTGHRDFRSFTRKTAIDYQAELLARRDSTNGSLATVHTKLLRVEKFHRWLALDAGFRRKIRLRDVSCFSLSRKDQIRARQRKEKPTPTLGQVLGAILAMPARTDIELRDRAAMALLLLTGIRAEALSSLKLKHVRSDGLGIDQDAAEVATKGGKSITSFFVPLDPRIQPIFEAYCDHLRSKLRFAGSHPLFPATEQTSEGGVFNEGRLSRDHWATTGPLCRICRQAFLAVGEHEFTPHSIRRMLVRESERRCATAEQFMAIAQNLGHSDPSVTFRSYGTLSTSRQAEVIASLTNDGPDDAAELNRIVRAVIREVRNTPSIRSA